MVLRVIYVVSGTNAPYAATRRRARSGCYPTTVGAGPVQLRSAMLLGRCYARSGTDVAYAGTRFPTRTTVERGGRYGLVAPCALATRVLNKGSLVPGMSGTNPEYTCTRHGWY
eukprot:950922-Rhodomonas_salina.1